MLINNSTPFGKKFQKTTGAKFLTHTLFSASVSVTYKTTYPRFSHHKSV